MRSTFRMFIALWLLASVAAAQSSKSAGSAAIDTARSTMTVHVNRSGIFSFAGDNHEISAPIASGSIDEAKGSVELTVNAAQMKVLDPALDAGKRSQVQEKMLSPEVLDPERYRTISFRSTDVTAKGTAEWLVRGQLTLHGETRPISLNVSRVNGHYRGTATVKQTEFGIKPVKVAGGTVKVKDEVKIDFDIVTK